MDIYDPIGIALGLEPIHIEFAIPKFSSSNPISPWNKGVKGIPSSRKGVKYGKQKFPKKKLSETHKNKLKGPNIKLKSYAADRSIDHLEKIKRAATQETTCKYCSKVAAQISIARWHNENCKRKPK